ncbi:MAG: class I SAM-dependent methyltransferase [Gammaproteobacteria bacterium]
MTFNSNGKFVGAIPYIYEEYLVPLIFEDYADYLVNRVDVPADGAILETAAGTGVVTRRLREQLPSTVSIAATDLNPDMLDVAPGTLDTTENVDFHVANAEDLPYEDNTFDAVVCQFGVMFFPDKQKSYREAARVLKPGGRFIFNLWNSLERNPFAKLVHETVLELTPEDPADFLATPFQDWDLSEIRAHLKAAGFEDVSTSVLSKRCTASSAKNVALGYTSGSPLATQLEQRGITATALSAVLDALIAEYGEGAVEAPMQAVTVSAKRARRKRFVC